MAEVKEVIIPKVAFGDSVKFTEAGGEVFDAVVVHIHNDVSIDLKVNKNGDICYRAEVPYIEYNPTPYNWKK